MKTKIIVLIMIITTMFIFVGCDSAAQTKPENDVVKIDDTCRFEYLGIMEKPYSGDRFYYWRDTTTDVVYVTYKSGSGNGAYGGFTPLLNADGTPILWNDIKNEKED